MIGHLNRYGDLLHVWGMPVRMITIVAIVRKIEIVSTKVNFELEDETGTIKGFKWLNSDVTSYDSTVEKNAYAKISGVMRTLNKDKFVNITSIKPLKNLNELLAHLMEVTVVGLEGKNTVNRVAQNDHTLVNNTMNATASNMDQDVNAMGLTREQAIVLNIMKGGDPDYGAERNDIKRRVPPNIASQVDKILEFLSDEGHIYTTKTDDYFKVI